MRTKGDSKGAPFVGCELSVSASIRIGQKMHIIVVPRLFTYFPVQLSQQQHQLSVSWSQRPDPTQRLDTVDRSLCFGPGSNIESHLLTPSLTPEAQLRLS